MHSLKKKCKTGISIWSHVLTVGWLPPILWFKYDIFETNINKNLRCCHKYKNYSEKVVSLVSFRHYNITFSPNASSVGGEGSGPLFRPAPVPPSRLQNSPRMWPSPPSHPHQWPSEEASTFQPLPHQRGWRENNSLMTFIVTPRLWAVLAWNTTIWLTLGCMKIHP